jgi:hypothetical protein
MKEQAPAGVYTETLARFTAVVFSGTVSFACHLGTDRLLTINLKMTLLATIPVINSCLTVERILG